MAWVLTEHDFERVRQGILHMRDLPAGPRLTHEDWRGSVAVFLLVFLSTFPVVIPFVIFRDVEWAMRASNAVAIVLLFVSGFALARYGGYHPWRTGLSLVVLGTVLVAITIALGG
jgi:VIT1/CCC1 family predicted Fe2+/Mn2+ transporter